MAGRSVTYMVPRVTRHVTAREEGIDAVILDYRDAFPSPQHYGDPIHLDSLVIKHYV